MLGADLIRSASGHLRATGGRDGQRLELFAEMCQGLISRGRSHPGLLPLANLSLRVSRLLPAAVVVQPHAEMPTTKEGLATTFGPPDHPLIVLPRAVI
jgi:hypothetical protein